MIRAKEINSSEMHVNIILKKLEVLLNERLIDGFGPLLKFNFASILALFHQENVALVYELLNTLGFLIGFQNEVQQYYDREYH